MSFNYQRRIACALLIGLMLTGCQSTKGRLERTASTQGHIKAGINLPDWPDDCLALESHADIKVGDELRSVLVRERAALERQNARSRRCTSYYDDVKTKFGTR